jgi:predicted acetyltransferase
MGDSDVCIATDGGVDVGTATALSMHMHLRGKRFPCQGVAWVGTAKSHRRRSTGERGVASQVMEQIVSKARERGEVASALMPFRVSFYEHFGFGLVEQQNVWTVPMSLLPADADGRWRFGTPDDKPAMLACRARQALTGTCDVETSEPALDEWLAHLDADHQLFVDDRDGQVHAYTWVKTQYESERFVAQCVQPAWDSPAGLRSLLALLGSLRDQYSFARIVLPVDYPLNWILKERQIPHRPVEHHSAACRTISRMQVRALDHVAFLHGQRLTRPVEASVTIRVRESGGHASTFAVDFGSGVIEAKPSTSSPQLEVSDVVWAAIACGHLRATTAATLGLLSASDAKAAHALDVLAEGDAPFCHEYF